LAGRRAPFNSASERVVFVLNDLSILRFPDHLTERVILEDQFATRGVGFRQSANTVITVTDRSSIRPLSFNHPASQITYEASDTTQWIGTRN
jgi:hypothetical protein